VGDEHPIISIAIINVDLQMLSGNAELKVKLQVQAEKRRHIKMFRRGEAEASAVLQSTQYIGLLLVKGVSDFGDGAYGSSFGIEAVVKADGIEDVTQNSRKSQKLDFGDGAGVHSVFAKNLENVLLHMSPVSDDVVLVEKREETETVSAEEPKSVTQLINLIEIQPEVKHPVTEPMHTGHQPMMQHRAFIKG
jgi:hypothetical protein